MAFLEPLLVVAHLVGHDDDHRVVDLVVRVLVAAPAIDDLGDGGEGGLDAGRIQRDALDRLDDLGLVGRRLGKYRPPVVPEAHDHRQESIVG